MMSSTPPPPPPRVPPASLPSSTSSTPSGAYPATIFSADLPGGRSKGSFEVFATGLSCQAENTQTVLPLSGLRMRVSGIHHENLHFTHPDHASFEMVTQAREVLEHPVLRQHPAIAAQMELAEKQHKRGRMILPGCIAAVLIPLALLWVLREPIIDWIASFVPAEWENEIGDLFFASLQGQMTILEDPELEAQLDELVAPLLYVVPNPGYTFDFHLADDPSLNAFALPGGHIVLHSGLVMAAESPEDLLGILGHEIAHVTERHSLRGIIRSAGLLAAFQVLFGDLSGVAAIFADGGYHLISLQHSREAELEADRVGFEYLVTAEIDPNGLIRFFERLQEEIEAQGAGGLDGSLNFLSTHPMSSERQERLEELWAEAEPTSRTRPQSFDLASFQAALEGQLASEADTETP